MRIAEAEGRETVTRVLKTNDFDVQETIKEMACCLCLQVPSTPSTRGRHSLVGVHTGVDVRRVARDRGGDVPHVPGDSQYVVGEGEEARDAEVVVVSAGKYLTFAARTRPIGVMRELVCHAASIRPKKARGRKE